MATLNDVLGGSLAQAVQVQQIIDALKGTPNKGVPVALVSLNDANNYALTVQNDDPTNSRALSVLKADGTVLITADATGVTLGSPLNIAAGSITGTQIADGSIANQKLGPDVARANLLTNPGLEVWSRGAGPFTGNLVYGPDRWMTNLGGGSTMSITRVAGVDGTSTYAAQIVYVHSATSQLIQKVVNNSDLNELRSRTVSFSARVNSNAANAVQLNLFDSGVLNAVSAFHPGGSTWQTLTVTGTVSSLGAGGELHARLQFAASATVQVDDACLVVGSQPANYVPLHPADDLARCLRYYEQFAALASNSFAMATGSGTVNVISGVVPFKAKKVATPTITFNAAWNAQVGNGSAIGGTIGTTNLTIDGTALVLTSTPTNGTLYQLYPTSGAIAFSAEANP